MEPVPVVNALVPFQTRLADDGLVHVRGWSTSTGPLAVVAELDWALLVRDTTLAYDGPGIFTYPHYAIPAALVVLAQHDLHDPEIIVRMPAPEGERFDRVGDPEDPQMWESVEPDELHTRLANVMWPGPAPGRYVRPVVEEWIQTGRIPAP